MLKRLLEWARPKRLEFSDETEAWKWACANLKNELLIEAVIPALVEGRAERGEDGSDRFRLRLASRDGGRDFVAPVLPGAGGSPDPGDLVSFRIVKITDYLPEEAGVVGYIEAKLAPVYVTRRGWKIVCSYVPKNLKPQIRF